MIFVILKTLRKRAIVYTSCRLQISDGLNVNFYVKIGVISKVDSPAKPGASFTLTHCCAEQQALLARRSGNESAKMKSLAGDGERASGLWSRKWPCPAEGGAAWDPSWSFCT